MNYSESTYEEIEAEVAALLEINGDNLDAEAISNQKIFPKISHIYVQKSRKLEQLINQLNKVEFTRNRHYSGKMTGEHYKKDPLTEAVLKTDIPNHMAVDPLVVEMRSMVKECERIVKFLEDAKKSLFSRGFDIKNAVEYRKLMLGG